MLRGIDLEVARGETCVILGRSGGGKSVLLKHLVGLLQPTSGEVLVDGENVSVLPERKLGELRKKVGVLFQSGALFDSMNVAENIAFPLREAGLRDPAVIREKVAEALEMVNLAGEEAKMPENLSGGMRKRVGLARSIVSRPGLHPLRRADDRPRPDRHRLDQPPDSSLAKAASSHFRGRHARHEDRLSHG